MGESGSYKTIKHYAMGRFAHELCYVMPDERTAYCTDDGTNVGFYKFVANKAKDLSCGTLYAGKFTQTSDYNGGSFKLEWVYLANGCSADVEPVIRTTKFSNIFTTAEGNSTTGACPDGFTPVNTSAGFECLKLNPSMDEMAAFLETRRYAAYKGATTEFRKWEGISFNPNNFKLYTSMSEVGAGMSDGDEARDLGGPNHIRVPANTCGCVYALDVDYNYNAVNMYGEVCGVPDDSLPGNTCHFQGIANPDNNAVVNAD